MLRELTDVRQILGEPLRHWFYSDNGDLIVWYDDTHHVTGYQLCYFDGQSEKALTWQQSAGLTHHVLDDGETKPAHSKMTPVLTDKASLSVSQVLMFMQREGLHLDPSLFNLILSSLQCVLRSSA